MVSTGSYLLTATCLIAVVLSLGITAVRLRQRLLPTWQGAPARLIEAVTAIAILVWLGELLGSVNLLYAGTLIAAAILLATFVLWRVPAPSASGAARGTAQVKASASVGDGGSAEAAGPTARSDWSRAIAVGVIAVVFAHWGLTTKQALDRGIFNFDSLWYHMPFAVGMVQSHSVTGMHYTDTVFTNWFYPQNAELVHAVGILLTGRDTLSLFINFGWLALAFLAAWCVGRPYGRGHLSVVAAAILLECHTLLVREPGAAKNDLAAGALLLAAIAILINAWAQHDVAGPKREEGKGSIPIGWSLAAAGLAVGLAAGTKVTVLAMAAALTVAVVALAPAGRRRAGLCWWLVPALLGGGFWYLRNLVFAGSPLPEIAHLGPISLPHPVRLQTARPGFSISHYATDTAVWRGYFLPGLHHAFGVLWPLVVGGAAAAALVAVLRGRDRVVGWMGAVALFGMVAYLFTPLSAAGSQGHPVAFAINVRYLEAALLAGLVLLPLARVFDGEHRQRALMAVLLVVLLVTDRSDTAVRDPSRVFAWLLVLLLVVLPAALLYARRRGVGRGAVATGFAALALVVIVIGYPIQRDYLRDRFRNAVAATSIPGEHLNSAYRWAQNVSNARIGLVGTSAGFLQYGFYGTDLSNRVIYLGEKGPHGAFNAIPTCRAFRAAVNAAGLDYLITAPFLNFIHPSEPIPSPEAGWLRREPAVNPVIRSGPVTVWRVRGKLDPAGCGPANGPLRRIPNAPRG